jgi:hypothetical protein
MTQTKKATAKKLTLLKRLCKIGTNINVRTELHGEEPVPACDIALKGVLLSKAELNVLLGDERAYDALYLDRDGTPEPLFAKCLKPFALIDRFEGATVKLTLADDDVELELEDVKLANLKLEPQVGGLTSLSMQIQAIPTSEARSQIIAFVDSQVHAAISFGQRSEKDKRQQELPMGENVLEFPGAGDGEQTQS